MGKKVIRLTENELRKLVSEATCQVLDEIGGKTYASVHNATMRADSLIIPYKTKYLLHCQNLRGAAAILVFDLKQLYKLAPQTTIF